MIALGPNLSGSPYFRSGLLATRSTPTPYIRSPAPRPGPDQLREVHLRGLLFVGLIGAKLIDADQSRSSSSRSTCSRCRCRWQGVGPEPGVFVARYTRAMVYFTDDARAPGQLCPYDQASDAIAVYDTEH